MSLRSLGGGSLAHKHEANGHTFFPQTSFLFFLRQVLIFYPQSGNSVEILGAWFLVKYSV